MLLIFYIQNKEESQYETVPDITPQEEKTITDDILTETTDVTEGTDGVTEATTEAVAEVSEEATEVDKATEVNAGPVF